MSIRTTSAGEGEYFMPLEGVVFPPCIADVNNDGLVNVGYLVAVILGWGPYFFCKEDIDGNGAVDVVDLVEVITKWGTCIPDV